MYRLENTQIIPVSLEEAWDFFSSPKNLNAITPPDLSFEIISPESDIQRMYPGQIIRYKIQPFPLLKMNWVTEITQVREKAFFIDEQRFGPYKFWHHQHHFIPVENGVEMRDLLHYDLSFGPLGSLMNSLVVQNKIEGIFNFRKKKVDELFVK